VQRDIPQSDWPLRDALESLLSGPDEKDRAKGLVTGIPPETRLRSVSVKDGVATIDLSESFRFTASGVEGLTAELRQVVATATEFPTVQKVQILIEGKKVQYLGTEGIRIDEPLSPGSLAP
jgi:germination protein M